MTDNNLLILQDKLQDKLQDIRSNPQEYTDLANRIGSIRNQLDRVGKELHRRDREQVRISKIQQ